MIVVSIIAVLLSVAMASFTKARDNSRLKSCLKNMQVISWAKEEYAMEAGKSDGDPVNLTDLVPVYIRRDPECPSNGVYTPMPIGQNVDCTIAEHEP
jgi:Tfp pilus assembly protein PilE